MDYQVNINYQFTADNEAEAKDKAQAYVASNLIIKPIKESFYSPRQVASQCKSFRAKKKEYFCVFFLDTQNRVLGKEVVSIGTLNASMIHPRETFRTAIIKHCCSVIVAHNHPSGGLEPSPEDLLVTRRLKEAGKILGIELLDHIIVTAEAYTSIKEKGLL